MRAGLALVCRLGGVTTEVDVRHTDEELVVLRYVTHTGFMSEGPNEIGHAKVGL